MDLLPDGVTLLEAMRYFLKHHQGVSPVLLPVATERFLGEKKQAGLRSSTIKQYRQHLAKLCSDFDNGAMVHETTEKIGAWFSEKDFPGATRNNFRRSLSAFYGWCVANKFASRNPIPGIAAAVIDGKLPEVFSVKQVRALLQACADLYPELCPYLALGFFAGVRPNELMRLDWSAIEDGHVHIGAEVAKTRQQRYITIMDNLAEWLQQYPSKGPIAPVQVKALYRRVKCIREKAGISKWPEDVMRHSFATYHLALYQDAPKTSHELGHTDTDMLYRHYRNLAKKADAEKYFGIMPVSQKTTTNSSQNCPDKL